MQCHLLLGLQQSRLDLLESVMTLIPHYDSEGRSLEIRDPASKCDPLVLPPTMRMEPHPADLETEYLLSAENSEGEADGWLQPHRSMRLIG